MIQYEDEKIKEAAMALFEFSRTHHLRYSPDQFKPDYFIPDLSDDAPKYHWGCPRPKRRNEFDF